MADNLIRFQMVTSGDRELEKALDLLTGPKQGKALRQSAKAAIRPVLQKVKRDAPKKTGKLARYLKVYVMRARKNRGGARIVFPTRRKLGIADDAKGYYPTAQEYGFIHRGGYRRKEERGRGTPIPARSFLRRNFWSSKAEMIERFKSILWGQISKIASEVPRARRKP